MKRKYTKPVLVKESFQLDAAVAAGCKTKINYGEDDCVFDEGQFFNGFNCQFDLTGADTDGNDTLCYHGPTLAGGMIFISS